MTTDNKGCPKWVEAEVRSFGIQPIWELVVEQHGVQRTIRTTGNHRWFVGGGKAPRRYREQFTEQLRPGEFLQATTPRRLTGLRPAPYGIAHGLVWGDGTVSAAGSCNLVLWGEKCALTRFLPEDGYPVDDPNVAVPGLRHTMLPSAFKEPVRLSESCSYLYGWLAGYFAADGSVSTVDGQCILVSASLKSIDLVRDVCLRLGIRTGVANAREATALSDRGTYSLVIYSQDLDEQFFLKGSHLRKWLRFSERKRYANRDWKVVSARPTEEQEEVFCAVVPETHRFVLEGYLVTSNCWFSASEMYQVDQGARNVGKTERIKLRSAAHPFYHPGKARLLTAPELNHLRPLTDEVEKLLLGTRIVREMLPTGKGAGIARQPHWQVRFKNGASIMSRLPNKDGKGVKGMHVVELDLDEAQDYPHNGWREVVETLNAGDPDARWCCHGVSRGVRDSFYEKTTPNSGWKVHRPMAMNRPSWTPEERNNKIIEYGGSRQSVDYKRNIYGEHGDASNSVFVLAKLMACVDLDEGSTYNQDVYTCVKLDLEKFSYAAANSDDDRAALIHSWVDIPGEHFHGYSQRIGNTQVGAPNGYSAYLGGMDVGVTNHPSEILIFGQRTGSEFLELLTRVQMQRINTDDQMLVVTRLFALYGDRLRFGIDKTGVGFPIWDQLTRREFGDRVYGFGFSEKRVAGFEERDLQPGETQKDLARYRNVVEAATDWLRNDHVDVKRFRLPYDREILMEFQGQSYTTIRDNGDPYGVRRQYSGGSFHSLDAAKVAMATKYIPPLEDLLEARPTRTPVLDVFMGA